MSFLMLLCSKFSGSVITISMNSSWTSPILLIGLLSTSSRSLVWFMESLVREELSKFSTENTESYKCLWYSFVGAWYALLVRIWYLDCHVPSSSKILATFGSGSTLLFEFQVSSWSFLCYLSLLTTVFEHFSISCAVTTSGIKSMKRSVSQN